MKLLVISSIRVQSEEEKFEIESEIFCQGLRGSKVPARPFLLDQITDSWTRTLIELWSLQSSMPPSNVVL